MTFETTPDGMTALRVQVRSGLDGLTRAGLQMPDTSWLVLCSMPSAAYEASTDVQGAFIALSQAIVKQLVAELFGADSIHSVHCVPPDAPLDTKPH